MLLNTILMTCCLVLLIVLRSQGLTKQCHIHWEHVLSSKTSDPRAMAMFDANGKKEAGMLEGNTVFEGDYWQCVNIQANSSDPNTSAGLYCINYWVNVPHVNLTENKPLHAFTLNNYFFKMFMYGYFVEKAVGFCIPHTCSDEDAKEIFPSVNPYDDAPQNVSDVKLTQCDRGKDSATTISSSVVLVILCLLAAPVIPATLYDVIQHHHLSQKSASTNNTQQKHEKDSENGGKNGIELAKDTATIDQKLVHDFPKKNENQQSIFLRLLRCYSLRKNIPDLLSSKPAPGSYTCINGIRFLSMAWIILGHLYFEVSNRIHLMLSNTVREKEMRKSTFYQGISQMVLAVETFFLLGGMLVTISFLRSLDKSKGKITKKFMAWFYLHRYFRLTPVYMVVLMFDATIFVYIASGPFFNNYTGEELCRFYFWKNALYIDNLFPLEESWCMPWTWYLSNDFQFYCISPIFTILIYNIVTDEFVQTYMRPWNRIKTYLMGMLLGYIIYSTKGKVKLNKIVVITGWVLSFLLFPVVIYTPYVHCTVKALMNFLYPCIIGWIIFACVTGYGGIVNSILSWKAMIPLARLTYVGYLVHYMLIDYVFWTMPVQIYIDHTLMTFLFLGQLTMTMVLAFFISLLYEIPVMRMDKVLYSR